MKKRFSIKEFASKVAISFFFGAIFVVLFYFLIEEMVAPYISLINTTAIGSSVEVEALYNFNDKVLIKYPSYGSKYADIEISSINLKLPVYHGDNKKILRKGVGHYTGSYFPGEGGSILYAAHNNPGFFQKLDQVKKGDIIKINTTYGEFKYEVYDMKVVKETDLSAFPIKHDGELLMLYTCWPINRSVVGRKTQRYVVYAKGIGEYDE